jgi:hypothetical protein
MALGFPEVIRWVFLGTAGLEGTAALLLWLHSHSLSGLRAMAAPPPTDARLFAQRYLIRAMIVFALTESVMLMGMILSFVHRSPNVLTPFAVVSFLLHAYTRPRLKESLARV